MNVEFERVLTHRNEKGREVSLINGCIVKKSFLMSASKKKEWLNEVNILECLRLSPIKTPNLISLEYNGELVNLYKEYVPGCFPVNIKEYIHELSLFFNTLHKDRVTTNDVSRDNLLLTTSEEFCFIDYGKASKFKRNNIALIFAISRELYLIRRELLTQEEFRVFMSDYTNKSTARAAVRISNKAWEFRDYFRKIRKNRQ